MKGTFLFWMFFGVFSITYAQKVVKKSIVNQKVSHLKIDVNNCFEIDLATSDDDVLLIEAYMDGEYEKDLLLQVSEEGYNTIKVSAGFQPGFVKPNDKLSAHKVVSIALKVTLPKRKNIHVFGTSCNVSATGVYDFLKVSLNDGHCDLDNVIETAEVRTQSGHISTTYSDIVVEADSRYGKIIGEVGKNGNGHYSLSTITGDIVLNRVE